MTLYIKSAVAERLEMVDYSAEDSRIEFDLEAGNWKSFPVNSAIMDIFHGSGQNEAAIKEKRALPFLCCAQDTMSLQSPLSRLSL